MEAIKPSTDLKELIGTLREKEVDAWDRGDKRSLWRIAFLLRAVNHALKLEKRPEV